MTLVSEFRLMSLSVLYDLMYPVSVLTNVLSILDTFNTGVTERVQWSGGEYGGSDKTDFETWERIGLALTSHMPYWLFNLFFFFFHRISSFWHAANFNRQIPEIDTQYQHDIAKIYEIEIRKCVSRAKIIVHFACYYTHRYSASEGHN